MNCFFSKKKIIVLPNNFEVFLNILAVQAMGGLLHALFNNTELGPHAYISACGTLPPAKVRFNPDYAYVVEVVGHAALCDQANGRPRTDVVFSLSYEGRKASIVMDHSAFVKMGDPKTFRCALMKFAYKVSELFNRYVKGGVAESLNIIFPAYDRGCNAETNGQGRQDLRKVKMIMNDANGANGGEKRSEKKSHEYEL
jgi:hypothetical protein